ncbi:MAG: DUF433 domain-containing protein [Thermomicrobiales bacterium]
MHRPILRLRRIVWRLHYGNCDNSRGINGQRDRVSDPLILGGEPTIAGTRLPVRAVVLMDRMHGGDLSRVQRSLPTLTAKDIRLALDYYERHRREILDFMRKNGVDEDLLRREDASQTRSFAQD